MIKTKITAKQKLYINIMFLVFSILFIIEGVFYKLKILELVFWLLLGVSCLHGIIKHYYKSDNRSN